MDAFIQYKLDHNYKYRFEVLIRTLYASENVILVLSILGFIRNLLSSILDGNKRNMMKSEFT